MFKLYEILKNAHRINLNGSSDWLVSAGARRTTKEFWMRIWDSHICSRDHLKLNLHEYGNNFFYKNTENIENIPENYKRMPLNVNNVNHSFNRASTYAMNRFQDALIGKYGGCPWRTGKVYDKNPIHGYYIIYTAYIP